MEKNTNSICYQLFGGWTNFEIFYITSLLWIQVAVYIIAPDSYVGMISGIAGVLAVVLGMKGRKLNFIFGVIQCAAMAFIAFKVHSYGYFIMSLVYLISMPIGFLLWGKNEDKTVKFLSSLQLIILLCAAIVAWYICGLILEQIDGQLPYLDSLNLIIPLIAQALYVLKYKENWILWIVVNIVSFCYWIVLAYQVLEGCADEGTTLGASLSQMALQGALLFNSIYALIIWNHYSKIKTA